MAGEDQDPTQISTLVFAPWLNPKFYNEHLRQKFRLLREGRGWHHLDSDPLQQRAFPDRFDFDSTFAVIHDHHLNFLASLRLTSMSNQDFPYREQIEQLGLIRNALFSRLNHFMLSDFLLLDNARKLLALSSRTQTHGTVLATLLADAAHYLRSREKADVLWYSAELQNEFPEFLDLGLQILSSPYPLANERHVMMAVLINNQDRLANLGSPLSEPGERKTLFIHELASQDILASTHQKRLPEVLHQRAILSQT